MSLKKNDYISFFNEIFTNVELNDLIRLKIKVCSIREYARLFEIPYPSFRLKMIKYLNNKFGIEKSLEIRSRLWPSTHFDTRLKKSRLKNEIISQLRNFYPENKSRVDTLSDLAYNWNLNRITITKWIKEWIGIEYGNFEANQIFDEVWGSKKNRNNPLTYSEIKKFIKKRHGQIITREELFSSMKERPTKRYIEIKCNKNHQSWILRVGHLIYDNTWCPTCLEHKCQELMRFYMNHVFNSNFKSEVSIRRACGYQGEVSKKIELNNLHYKFTISTGKLRFDGYNGNFRIKGQDRNLYSFKIAFEYDGIQHDNFTPIFHKNLSDFANQLIRDKVKKEIAENHKIILIRLKEYDGFNWNFLFNNPIRVQKEIIEKFYQKVEKIHHISKKIVKISPNLDLKYEKSINHQRSIDKFV